MKTMLVISIMASSVLFVSRCTRQSVENKKDLDENMLDMMMYHDNLGLYLRKKNADYASWLLEGMDSSLKVISKKFTEHRKLTDPFEKSYEKLLKPPINEIRKAIRKEDFPRAVEQYRLLTKKCNNCHADLDIDKKVVDRTSVE
jgi:hypothetical protein